jgi:hypothetical protein
VTATPPGEQPTDPGQQRFTDDELLIGMGRDLDGEVLARPSAALIRRLAVGTRTPREAHPRRAQRIPVGVPVTAPKNLYSSRECRWSVYCTLDCAA